MKLPDFPFLRVPKHLPGPKLTRTEALVYSAILEHFRKLVSNEGKLIDQDKVDTLRKRKKKPKKYEFKTGLKNFNEWHALNNDFDERDFTTYRFYIPLREIDFHLGGHGIDRQNVHRAIKGLEEKGYIVKYFSVKFGKRKSLVLSISVFPSATPVKRVVTQAEANKMIAKAMKGMKRRPGRELQQLRIV